MQKNIHPFCVAVAPSSCHSCRTPHSAYKTNICESDSLYQRGHRIHLALQQSLVPNLGAKRRYKFVAVQSISQRVQQPRHRRRKILDRLNDDPVYLKKKWKKRMWRFRKNRVLIEFERGDLCPKKDQNAEKQ